MTTMTIASAQIASQTLAPTSSTIDKPTSLAAERIVLCGFMGAGKTSVGRLLADALGWEFLDLDAHLQARTGTSIPNIFARDGETHFRRLESSALVNALARRHIVLALGGGTPEQLTNRLLLEQTPATTIVFLDAPFAKLYDRCVLESFAAPADLRPVLTSPAEAEARFHSRLPHYRRLAQHTVSTGELSAAQVAGTLLDLFSPQARQDCI